MNRADRAIDDEHQRRQLRLQLRCCPWALVVGVLASAGLNRTARAHGKTSGGAQTGPEENGQYPEEDGQHHTAAQHGEGAACGQAPPSTPSTP